MSEWKETTLGDFLTFQRGFDITKKQMVEDGIYDVIFSSGIGGKHNEYKVEAYGVVIGRKGTLGTVFYSENKFWATDTTLWVKDFHGNYPKFAYYFLHTLNLGQYDCGSANPTLNRNHIHTLDVKVPSSVKEQKQIADVLSCLDAKIENLRQQNETLEAIAKTLFKHWFIDFEFPNADDKPYKSSGGEMVDSAIGDIPEGWKAGKLDNLTKISTGKGLKRDDFKNNGVYPVLGANGEIGRTDQFLTEGESILTGRVGTLGIVNINYVKAWISDNVIIFNPFDNFFYYTYFYLKNTNLKNLNRGSTQPLITQGDLKAIETLIPDIDLISHFQIFCQKIFKKKKLNLEQIQTLTKTRDALLPKLMSGQLRVKE